MNLSKLSQVGFSLVSQVNILPGSAGSINRFEVASPAPILNLQTQFLQLRWIGLSRLNISFGTLYVVMPRKTSRMCNLMLPNFLWYNTDFSRAVWNFPPTDAGRSAWKGLAKFRAFFCIPELVISEICLKRKVLIKHIIKEKFQLELTPRLGCTRLPIMNFYSQHWRNFELTVRCFIT